MTDEPLRLFVALELPDAVRGALPEPGPDWRPVAREALHVTLAFLGWRPESDVAPVEAAVRSALAPVGELVPRKAIGLPPRAPRVLAVELEDVSGGLLQLQGALALALERAGLFVRERRPFLPHVTIGRARGRMGRGAPMPAVEPTPFRPQHVSVFRSRLHPSGARYEALARLELPGGE